MRRAEALRGAYQSTWAESCSSRGKPAASRIWPKEASPNARLGPRRSAKLKTLISSARTDTVPVPSRCDFWTAMSADRRTGVRTRPSARGALPNVNGAACDHAAGFSHRMQPQRAS